MRTYAVELYNGYDVSYLSAKTNGFVKNRRYARRFATREEAENAIQKEKEKSSECLGNVGSFYVDIIGR